MGPRTPQTTSPRAGVPRRQLLGPVAREPFVHFLLLGALIFGLYAAFGRDADPATSAIVIDAARVDSIRARMQAQLGRPPQNDELIGEIASDVRQELLYREGLALGIDRDDVIVKRRLAQKMEFLAADLAPPVSDAEVRAAYDAEPERYVRPRRCSFRQIYLAADGGEARSQAEQTLARLRAGQLDFATARAASRPSLLPESLQGADREEIDKAFGGGLAERLLAVEAPGWLGPLESSFGLHLVEVTDVLPPEPLAFEAVEAQIRARLERERREQSERSLYAGLREKYPVRLEGVSVPGLEQAVF